MATVLKEIVTTDWERVCRVLLDSERVLITTHMQADPDALGSELALAEALRTIAKKPVIVNPTPISNNYRFLDSRNEISVHASEDGIPVDTFDSVFILDISRWERLGTLAEPISKSSRPKICIDHHPYIPSHEDLRLVSLEACATAEIVYDLIRDTGIPINQRIAECLYTAILTDTGAFSFSNTNARSHKIAADLLSYGIDSRHLYEQVYQNSTPARLRFLGAALSRLQVDCNKKLAWMSVGYDQLREFGIHPDEIDGFADLPRNCRECLLSVLFLELEPGDVKISLRAKGDFNANKLATRFGGGGHAHASGIRIKGRLEDVMETILAAARADMQPFLV